MMRDVPIVNPERLDPELGVLALCEMSWTRLEMYDARWSDFACPRKFKIKYIDGVETGWARPLAIGSIVHGVIEKVVEDRVTSDAEISALIIERIERHDPDKQLADDEIEAVTAMTKASAARIIEHTDGVDEIVGIEMPFRYIIGAGLFRGYMDLVTREHDERGPFLHVIDHKSGKPNRKRAEDHGQLHLYGLVLRRMFPGERIKGSLHWTKADGPRAIDTFEMTDEGLDAMEQEFALSVARMVLDESFKPDPKPLRCTYCDFAGEQCKAGAWAAKSIRKRWQTKG